MKKIVCLFHACKVLHLFHKNNLFNPNFQRIAKQKQTCLQHRSLGIKVSLKLYVEACVEGRAVWAIEEEFEQILGLKKCAKHKRKIAERDETSKNYCEIT